MAQDVAKLLIVVGSKGAEKTSKDLDKVTTSSKGLATQTNKTKTLNEKFGTTMNKIRASLAPTAAAVYLVQGAYRALTGAVSTLTDAYETQFTAEVKLETIMRSTGNAVGYTAEQLEVLSKNWEELTGINDAVLTEAAAIGATFTQISQEVFPDLIEQALNMSTIFRQDLKQSIIQLGVATNNLQVSRLTRIGISFTEQQKEQIRVLRQSGKVLEAQQVIMAELEAEIGGVAKAMGETSLGTIRKFNNAWTNLFEELGEQATTFWADLLNETNLQGFVDKVKNVLANTNAFDSLAEAFSADQLTNNIFIASTSFTELQEAMSGALSLQRQLKSELQTTYAGGSQAEGLGGPLATILRASPGAKAIESELSILDEFIATLENVILTKRGLSLIEQDELDKATALKKAQQEAEALKKLREEYMVYTSLKNKAELAGIDDKFEQQRRELELEWLDIRKDAWEKHGLTIEQLNELTGNYYDTMLSYINEAEQAEKRLFKEQERKQFLDLYGSDEQKKAAEYTILLNDLNKMVKNGTINWIDYNNALDQIFADNEDEDVGWLTTFLDGLFNLEEQGEKSKEIIQELQTSLEDLGKSAALDLLATSFEMIGASLAGVSDDAKTWEEAMAEIVAASLTSIGPALMSAGAQLLATPGGVANPLAWALLAAGAATSVGGGYISQSVANLAGGSSGETETASSQAVNFQDVNLEESGLNSSNSGDTSVIVNNNTSAEVSTRITEDGAGNRAVEFVIDSAVTKTARNYGLNKVPVNIA